MVDDFLQRGEAPVMLVAGSHGDIAQAGSGDFTTIGPTECDAETTAVGSGLDKAVVVKLMVAEQPPLLRC